MAVGIKINKEDASLEEIQFLFENPKNNFYIYSFDEVEGDYFELEIGGFEEGEEEKAKKAVLEEIEKIREEDKDIRGSIVFDWINKYVDGKAIEDECVLGNIGIAGKSLGFTFFKKESDLKDDRPTIEKRAILLTKEEIDNVLREKGEGDLKKLIYEKLNSYGWKWDRKQNPNNKETIKDIDEIINDLVGKYAYIEKENGEKIDLSKYFEKSPYTRAIKIPSIEEEGILKTNAHQIFLEKNLLTAIEAPETLWITDEESPLIRRVEAPKCTNLFLTECKNLKVENIKIDKEGSLIMRMGETYYNNNKKISDKNYYDLKDNTTTYLIAPNATEITIENTPLLEKVYAPNCEILHCIASYQLKEENILVDENCYICLHNRVIMGDAIIVLHTEEKYGNKNLIDIELTSEKDFEEEDEDYSILCSKEEIRDILKYSKTEQELKDFIYKKLENINWNDFKYNPHNLNMRNKISKIAIDLKGASAFIEKENGEKIDISRNIRVKYLSFGRVDELIIEKEQEEGKLVTNVFNIECSNSMITSIEAPEARSIYCENCENLATIKAPECEELHCKNCPELKEENMNLSYDCEIEGLEKKNQLKR